MHTLVKLVIYIAHGFLNLKILKIKNQKYNKIPSYLLYNRYYGKTIEKTDLKGIRPNYPGVKEISCKFNSPREKDFYSLFLIPIQLYLPSLN